MMGRYRLDNAPPAWLDRKCRLRDGEQVAALGSSLERLLLHADVSKMSRGVNMHPCPQIPVTLFKTQVRVEKEFRQGPPP